MREPITKSRLHQARDHLRPIAAVAIEKDQDLCPILDRCGGTPGAGAAVAALAFHEDPGAGGTGYGNRAVAAAAIDDDDLVDPLARYRRNDRADRPFFVEHRDDRGDARPPHKLQRTPHEAQAAGGVSLNNAERNSW
jgi:hypothetical protein